VVVELKLFFLKTSLKNGRKSFSMSFVEEINTFILIIIRKLKRI